MSKLKDSCIICNTNITDSSTISVTENMRPLSNPELTLYTFFQSISNFNLLDISEVPQNACDKCYQDALHALDFQTLCNKAVDNLKIKSEVISTVCVGSDCDDDLSINESLSLYLSEEDTKDTGYNVDEMNVEISTSDNARDEDIASLPAPVPAKRKRQKPSQLSIQANKQRQSERVECEHCHKLYTRDYMYRHKRIHTGERPYKCKLCPKDFWNSSVLKLHTRTHSDEQPYVCKVCEAKFRSKSALNYHTLVHTGAQPYMCKICGKNFRSKSTHDNHYTIHTNAKPFVCTVCGKTFRLKSHHDRHCTVHSNAKPFICKICGKTFRSKDNHDQHYAIHSDEKPFMCKICGKTFRTKGNHDRHYTIHSDA